MPRFLRVPDEQQLAMASYLPSAEHTAVCQHNVRGLIGCLASCLRQLETAIFDTGDDADDVERFKRAHALLAMYTGGQISQNGFLVDVRQALGDAKWAQAERAATVIAHLIPEIRRWKLARWANPRHVTAWDSFGNGPLSGVLPRELPRGTARKNTVPTRRRAKKRP